LFTPRSYDHVLPDSKSSKCSKSSNRSKSTPEELDKELGDLYDWL